MICPNCKSIQPDSAQYCSVCSANMLAQAAPQYQAQPQYQAAPQYQMPQNQPVEEIKDYSAMAIIATVVSVIFCNIIGLVCGIFAIVYSGKVKDALAAGRYAEAQSASATAKICSIIALVLFGLSILGIIGYCVFVFLLLGAAAI